METGSGPSLRRDSPADHEHADGLRELADPMSGHERDHRARPLGVAPLALLVARARTDGEMTDELADRQFRLHRQR
jgi:hypothetical protein